MSTKGQHNTAATHSRARRSAAVDNDAHLRITAHINSCYSFQVLLFTMQRLKQHLHVARYYLSLDHTYPKSLAHIS